MMPFISIRRRAAITDPSPSSTSDALCGIAHRRFRLRRLRR
jgi:hypothetical protein